MSRHSDELYPFRVEAHVNFPVAVFCPHFSGLQRTKVDQSTPRSPKIQALGNLFTQGQTNRNYTRTFVVVEIKESQGNGRIAVQLAIPHLLFVHLITMASTQTFSHATTKVLINANNIAILQNFGVSIGNGPDIAPNKQGTGNEGPESHLHTCLFEAQPLAVMIIAHQQHVGVVKGTLGLVLSQGFSVPSPMHHDALQRPPGVIDIRVIPPRIATCLVHLGKGFGRFVVTQIGWPTAGKDNFLLRGNLSEFVAPLGIIFRHVIQFQVTPIEFQVIHSPIGKGLCINGFIIFRARIATTGMRPHITIRSKQNAPCVQVVRQVPHTAGKAVRIGYQALRFGISVILDGPTIVNVHAIITGGHVTSDHHGVGHARVQVFIDALVGMILAIRLTHEAFPTHKPHGWGCQIDRGAVRLGSIASNHVGSGRNERTGHGREPCRRLAQQDGMTFRRPKRNGKHHERQCREPLQ
mmetsp:Transcript_6758/g.12984  ORF Transcript_6758/g.12984 Transcript_6758/m.12984 type:complete len:466 (-) Transcript_6758:86-1483(-)